VARRGLECPSEEQALRAEELAGRWPPEAPRYPVTEAPRPPSEERLRGTPRNASEELSHASEELSHTSGAIMASMTLIDRAVAAGYGREAVRISDDGWYAAPSGRRVEIAAAVREARERTVEYLPGHSVPTPAARDGSPRIEVVNESTIAAARRLVSRGRSVVILNFAAAGEPGGGFLSGARAQEESLCWSSALYRCLVGREYYEIHRRQRHALQTDAMIYSPEVPFFRGDDGALLEEPLLLSVITAAAPNAGALRRYGAYDREEVMQAFRQRIERLLRIGLTHGHDAIVLGAWGCGAFGNASADVAPLFGEAIDAGEANGYSDVVFAILDWSDERRFIGPFEAIAAR
jgi:uncharacterized protein (TIGR02452 family)